MARSQKERARYERREQEAWIGDSYFRAEQARGKLKDGLPVTAMQLALAGLPEDPENSGARPWVGETAGALAEAMGVQPELRELRGNQGGVLSVAFSAQGDWIVSGGSYGTVRLWRLDGTPAAAPFKGHEGTVYSVAFSPQGDRIVSGGKDGTVRLWRLDGTPAAAPFKGHEGEVYERRVLAAGRPDRLGRRGWHGAALAARRDARGRALQGP